MPPPTADAVLDALRAVDEPLLHQGLVDLALVQVGPITGDRVEVTVVEPADQYPLREELVEAVRSAVAAVEGVGEVAVRSDVLDGEGQVRLRERLIGDPEATAGSQPGHGHAEGRAIPFA